MSVKNCSLGSWGTHRRNMPDLKYSLPVEERLSILEALDHLHVTKKYKEVGSCTVCKKLGTRRCFSCWIFYCSNECQSSDWMRHKTVCKKADHVNNSSISKKSKDGKSSPGSRFLQEKEKGDEFTPESLLMKASGSPFTALANQLNKKPFPDQSHHSARSLHRFPVRGPHSTAARGSYNKRLTNKKRSDSDKRENSIGDKSSSSSAFETPLENSVPPVVPKLREVKKKEVIGMYRESADRYWVMDLANVPKFREIQTTLGRECDRFERVAPEVGLVCGCYYSDEWFRGKILSLSPKPRVRYIDYGNVSTYDFGSFKRLPEEMKSLPGLAFLIEFEEGTPEEYRTRDLDSLQFTVEETRKTPDGVSCVEVTEGAFETDQPSAVPHMPKPPKSKDSSKGSQTLLPSNSVMDSIKVGSRGMLFLLPGEGRTRFGSLVPDDNQDAGLCIEKVLHVSKSNLSPVEAKEGDYVLVADKQGNDQRGKVLTRKGSLYHVQLIDCGNVITAEKVYPLSEDLINLIELGVKITVEEPRTHEKIRDLETCFFLVTGQKSSGKWTCTLKGETESEIFGKVLIEKPPKTAEPEERFALLKSGSTVEITALCPPNSLYIRAVDAETEQKFMEMNAEMIEFASKAGSYIFPPDPDVLCCARFALDNCFYRAVVTSFGTRKVKVLFVDFGNEQETDLMDVKPIPSSLRDIPFFAVKVSLKGVSEMTKDPVKKYLNKLVLENVELTLSYEGAISDGVTLKEKRTGVVVNEFLENAAEEKPNDVFPLKAVPHLTKKNAPVSRGTKPTADLSGKAAVSSYVFLDDDLQYTIVPPGTQCELALLYVNETEFETSHTFWGTDAASENFHLVNGDLNAAIGEHCSRTTVPYRPSVRELCLAEFEGLWYRAIAVSCVGDDFNVFFVDFGNVCTLKPESIRSIKKEFIQAPALAMSCTINEPERFKGKPELTKKVLRILMDRVNTCFQGVTVTKFENDTFSVVVREIEDVLRE